MGIRKPERIIIIAIVALLFIYVLDLFSLGHCNDQGGVMTDEGVCVVVVVSNGAVRKERE